MANKNEKNIVKIHGRDYITVAGRLQLAHEACEYISINTELVSTDPVTVKATIALKRKGSDHEETYSDYSAANPNKLIEKQSPIEVASTSAVGRALGYAGFGTIESVASADEMIKGGYNIKSESKSTSVECTCSTTGKYHALDCPARTATVSYHT